MPDNQDSFDKVFGEAAGCAVAAVVGLIVGILAGRAQQKRLEDTRLRFPEHLESDYDVVPAVVTPPPPPDTRPWYVQLARLLIFFGGYSAFFLGLFGIAGFASGNNQGVCAGAVSFVAAVCLGYGVVWLWNTEKRYPRPDLRRPPPDPAPAPVIPPLDLTRAQMYTITLPKSFDWQPQLAGRFMEHILHKIARLTFQIVAEQGQLRWRIVDLRRGLDPGVIRQAVNDFYPEAHIEVGPVPRRSFTSPFYRYTMAFQQVAEPLFPIVYVETFTQADPLVHLAQEMSMVGPGERVIFTLFVADRATFVYDQLEQLLTVKQTKYPFRLLSPQGWVEAGFEMTSQQDQLEPVYGPELEQVVMTKLTNLVYQCLLLMQVEAPTLERVKDLARLDTHLLAFKNLPYNGLAEFDQPWPESIETIDTPDRDWATSTFGLLDSWLTNTSRRWQRFRLLLDSREAAALWHLPHQEFTASTITWTRKRVQVPSVMRGWREGVFLGANFYGGQMEPVCLPHEDRATHINILGKTGVGKSTLLHHLIFQDIHHNRGVAVVDPHGRLVRDILQTSIPPGREDDVVVLDLANEEYPPPLNPMGGAHSRAAVTRIISILDKVYGGWENAPRMANALSSALMTLHTEPHATVRDVARLFLEEGYRARLLGEIDDEIAAEFWEHEYENFSEGQQQQIRDPVVYRMRTFYGNRDLYPVVCHPDTLDFGQLMREGRVILLSLGMDEERIPERERNLLGAMLVSQLQMAAMGGAKTNGQFYLYIDEVQNFVTSALGEVFSEARKFGLSLVVANQYLKQLAGETLDAMMGNVGAMVTFQCGLEDGRALSPYLRPGFETEDLVNLDKYQAAVKLRFRGETQPAFSLMGLAPLEKPPDAEERERRIRARSIELYTPKTREEVMAWLNARYPRKGRNGRVQDAPDIYEG